MKKSVFILAAFAILTGMTLLNSCKKDDSTITDVAALNAEQAADAEDVSSSSDDIDDDMETILSASSLKSTESVSLPCNISIDSTTIGDKEMTVTFNGDNCRGTRNRSGQIIITLTHGDRWSDEGAVLTVQYINVKITCKANGRYIILNGTKTHTNVSGGLVKNLTEGQTILRTIESSDMEVTFTNGTKRSWNLARQRSFTMEDGNIVIQVEGFGEADGKSDLVEWGTNRRNTAFYTQITSPIVMSSACDYYPSSGVKVHYVALRTVTTTLGTDVNGDPITSGCADYYKIVWEGVNGTKTAILPYK